MAGHSKWANIQHRKGRQDSRRGQLFTKLIREITIAAKLGGAEKTSPRLSLAIAKARDANMPKDKIQNAIDRGAGKLDGVDYIECRYEGYGINGTAVMVDCLTDNKVRTVADIRHAFTKHHGKLGTDGCVAHLFRHVGIMLFAAGVPEDPLMEAALAADAEDVICHDDGTVEVLTLPEHFIAVEAALEAAGFKAAFSEITYQTDEEVILEGEAAVTMHKLLDALENLDDVQQVYTSAVMPP